MIAVLMLLAFSISFSAEVVISFGRLTPDRDIIKLLEKCNAKIRVLWHATPYGTGGSGARSDWHEPRKLFSKIRNELAYMDKTAYFDSTISFRIILENNLLKPEDLVKYTKLLKFIRGLVNNYYQQREAYFYIKNGEPIVYAVLAKTDDVECIERSDLVKDVSVNHFPLFTAFLKYVPYYFRPKKYSRYYFFTEVKNAKPKELFRMMKEAVKELEKDKEFLQYYEEHYMKRHYRGENLYQHRLRFLRKSIQHQKRLSMESIGLESPPPPTYFPNDGDIEYTGTTVVRYNEIWWDNPGDWSVDRPGYEHDLVARRDYFTDCSSQSNLPEWYDDCPTACVDESSSDYCAFSFGTYNALLIEPAFPYWGRVNLTRGLSTSTDFRLNAQEVFHSPVCFKFLGRWTCIPCPFDTPWCMGGTPFRDGNPYLNCPKNSITLKTCEFRRFFSYWSVWSGKYDCTDASWCD